MKDLSKQTTTGILVMLLLGGAMASAGVQPEWQNAEVIGINKEPPHAKGPA
jgi:hypothetical protein